MLSKKVHELSEVLSTIASFIAERNYHPKWCSIICLITQAVHLENLLLKKNYSRKIFVSSFSILRYPERSLVKIMTLFHCNHMIVDINESIEFLSCDKRWNCGLTPTAKQRSGSSFCTADSFLNELNAKFTYLKLFMITVLTNSFQENLAAKYCTQNLHYEVEPFSFFYRLFSSFLSHLHP